MRYKPRRVVREDMCPAHQTFQVTWKFWALKLTVFKQVWKQLNQVASPDTKNMVLHLMLYFVLFTYISTLSERSKYEFDSGNKLIWGTTNSHFTYTCKNVSIRNVVPKRDIYGDKIQPLVMLQFNKSYTMKNIIILLSFSYEWKKKVLKKSFHQFLSSLVLCTCQNQWNMMYINLQSRKTGGKL